MQIFVGACIFVIAVLLLAYLPGKLLLIALNRTLNPLEDVTLACFLGLILSGLAYWLIMYVGQSRFFLLWPLGTGIAAVFAWIQGTKIRTPWRHSTNQAFLPSKSAAVMCDRSGIALAGVVAIGIIVLAYLPFYYTNFTWRADGVMRVCPVPDVLLHIAIANELTHTVPPHAPHVSGHLLSYHYGMDVAVAMFAKATGLNTVDLSVRFVPTLFLALVMLSIFCFSRIWLGSGYFAVLVVFLVFFGEDLSFIPGILFGENIDWSLRYFSVPPAVIGLFYTNPILPGIGLLFAGLFCLQRYLQERGGAWLLLTALLFVALIEVKIFTAAQIMCSLGVAAVLYLVAYRNSDLFKVAACIAAVATPLVWPVLLRNKSEANHVIKFDPGLYVSQAMEAIGIKYRLSGWLAFIAVALPIYLVGTLGLRVIGVPAILKAIFRPNPKSALRFILALFVVIGSLIALLFTITPAGWTFRYNPVSGTLFVQSKYIAWLFAVEVLQTLYRWAVARGMYFSVAATVIAAIAIALSVPATLQHFIYWRNPDHLFGNGKPFGKQLQSYDAEILAVTDFLTKDAQAGDVVLCGDELLAPVLALTNCRVPFGYFAYAAVPRSDYLRRESAVKQFWKDWRLGKVQQDLLREAEVRYILVRKTSEGSPATIPVTISNVFENSEFAVFKVDSQNITETAPKHL
jgi:hypothetical protein